ncbi:WD40 repeat-like protein, partial [Paxillus ammoniavirescens]
DACLRSVEFSPDLSRVMSGSYDLTVWVWSIETGELAFKPIKCYGSVFCVCYLPGGDRVASGAGSMTAFMFNISSGEQIAALKRHADVRGVAYSPSGEFIVMGCVDGKLCLW